MSNTVHVRQLPGKSPSLAVAMCRSSNHPTASGSRGTVTVPSRRIVRSSTASTPDAVPVPAVKSVTTLPVARSTTTADRRGATDAARNSTGGRIGVLA